MLRTKQFPVNVSLPSSFKWFVRPPPLSYESQRQRSRGSGLRIALN
jgi:hypothetical protein